MSLSTLIQRQSHRLIHNWSQYRPIWSSLVSQNCINSNVVVIRSNNLWTSGHHRSIGRPHVCHMRRPLVGTVSKRLFKQNNKFAHQKNVAPLPVSFLYPTVGIFLLFIIVFNVENIWVVYVPEIIRDPIETGLKMTWSFVRKICGYKRVDALTIDDKSTADEVIDEQSDIKSKKKKKNGFRDRKIIEYENRIRMYSNPDKVFRYFASLKIIYDQNETEIYMTPDDFLRALTPGIKQPDGLGLDQFKRIDLSKGNRELTYGLKADSMFYKLSNFGLINYSDFLFLLTVISVSRRHFEIAFRMFDLNGDGDVEFDEFEKVQNAILSQTSVGKKLGSSSKTGYKGVSSALAKYFFGEDLKQKLTTEKFLDFQKQLQTELLTLEFERKKPNPITGKLKEAEFADLLIAYAGLSENKRNKMIKRVKKCFGSDEEGLGQEGITLNDYLSLYNFLQNINDVDIALAVFNIAGASIDQDTLKHVAKTVAHVDLRDHLVKVLFTLFDENQDGQLSNKEFIAVMKERLRRGLTKPKDTGFWRLLHALWNSLKFDL
ncbi:calcium uptake protein 1 homolog, mitochondrial-like isoform X2 [Oppia nitens]|uniref:calcium uptake protein 1 homolog, mitochondrial-like isoform X2 n=1 Tax=Oppia nitens TaxID=1686743 RepID=UPI0023DBD180|nr:calcium uptake protein 1 homolog, mitochondrial-like isoform X2 [Oppia nitens]